MERPEIQWHDRPESVYLVRDQGEAYVSREAAEQQGGLGPIEEITLVRPSLAPVYGGETLLEALWSEMDTLMERLMTGAVAEDGGDRFRAEELAWVIAIVSNPYAPSMDQVRKEAMERWAAQQEEHNAIMEQNSAIRDGH